VSPFQKISTAINLPCSGHAEKACLQYFSLEYGTPNVRGAQYKFPFPGRRGGGCAEIVEFGEYTFIRDFFFLFQKP